MKCPHLDIIITDAFCNGHHTEDCSYGCNLTGEECTYYYDGHCNKEE